MRGRWGWLAVGVVVCLLLAGCSSSSHNGDAAFYFAWPEEGQPLAQARSLKIELRIGAVTQWQAVVNRPADGGTSAIGFSDIAPAAYAFYASAYDAPATAGVLLAQAAGSLLVQRKATVVQYLTTLPAAGVILRILPENPTVYIGHTLPLDVSAVNPDNAVVLVGNPQWSSATPAVATVEADTGVLIGVAPGTAQITATAGTLTAHTQATVKYAPPVVTLAASRTSIAPGESVVLSWTTTDAVRVVSAVNFNTVLLNGSRTVYPLETTEYSLTVSGPGGVATDSVTVTVKYPEPTVTLTADRTVVNPGENVTLSWSSTDATSVVSAENFNTTAVNGSVSVYPTATTTYRLTVRGPSGDATDSVTITVLGGG